MLSNFLGTILQIHKMGDLMGVLCDIKYEIAFDKNRNDRQWETKLNCFSWRLNKWFFMIFQTYILCYSFNFPKIHPLKTIFKLFKFIIPKSHQNWKFIKANQQAKSGLQQHFGIGYLCDIFSFKDLLKRTVICMARLIGDLYVLISGMIWGYLNWG